MCPPALSSPAHLPDLERLSRPVSLRDKPSSTNSRSSGHHINALIDNVNGLHNRRLPAGLSSVLRELEMRATLIKQYRREARSIVFALVWPPIWSAWRQEKRAAVDKIDDRLDMEELDLLKNIMDLPPLMLSEMDENKQKLVERTLAATLDIDRDDREFGESSVGRQGSPCSDTCNDMTDLTARTGVDDVDGARGNATLKESGNGHQAPSRNSWLSASLKNEALLW